MITFFSIITPVKLRKILENLRFHVSNKCSNILVFISSR